MAWFDNSDVVFYIELFSKVKMQRKSLVTP